MTHRTVVALLILGSIPVATGAATIQLTALPPTVRVGQEGLSAGLIPST